MPHTWSSPRPGCRPGPPCRGPSRPDPLMPRSPDVMLAGRAGAAGLGPGSACLGSSSLGCLVSCSLVSASFWLRSRALFQLSEPAKGWRPAAGEDE